MKRSEIFDVILDVVCGIMEVEPSDILSANRTEDVVIARSIIATFCKDYGMRNHHIQQFLRFKSHNSVRYLLDTYKVRKSIDRHFKFYSDTAAHELDKTMAKLGQ